MKRAHFYDPVAAYDRLADNYAELSREREPYLRSVEECICQRIPAGSKSLLDIGSGDGIRALRIAEAAAIKRVVLVEPSAEMIAEKPGQADIWPIRAEDLNPQSIGERFEVITCLWNVLGHVPGFAPRQRALSNVARLLTPAGKFFIDINHRYNARAYGVVPTAARWLRDHLLYNEKNSDVVATWALGENAISTYGHVFTDREMMRLARSAALELQERIVIDYADGRVRHSPFAGNLLYIFRRSSRMDSSSAPQTS